MNYCSKSKIVALEVGCNINASEYERCWQRNWQKASGQRLSLFRFIRARKYNLYCRSCKIICRRYNRSNTKRILFKVADYNHKRVKQALDEIYF
ncbi:hypothetical protein QE152_g25939 [Popillia japonica]|uniref:Uncharacterized protein n=1 Tax=Popillia japonica TaxID=7064 RepID=A0AAW1JZW2_POPJA